VPLRLVGSEMCIRDSATGAQFLQTLKQYIENPVTMLA
jgi:hypothetical protein